jgi:hypothetical protein
MNQMPNNRIGEPRERIGWRVSSDMARNCRDSAVFRGTLALALTFFLIVHSPALAASSEAPAAGKILRTLKSSHPRLMLDPAKIQALRTLIKGDEVAKAAYDKIKSNAEKTLKQTPVFYELRDGRRLIYVSGDVWERIQCLAFSFLMTRDRKYVDRAWIELEAASKFEDWNPDHFLDTAIMTGAFAVALDWLWDEWSPAQRETLRQSIVKLGLIPAMKVYDGKGGWSKVTNNWNQVCNGGIGMGALAVADTDPELAGQILGNAIKSLPIMMRTHAPDGGGHEGLGYWAFGSSYNIMLLDSLDRALGTDFGLSQIDGFKQSGDYQIYLSGTNREFFDFGDCNRSRASTPQHLWMGQKYGIPRYSWYRYDAISKGGGGLFDLLWFDASPKDFSIESMPLDKYFRNVEVASIRDSWTNKDGFIVAIQGGDNGGSHRHLDLGSFMLEAEGVRWIIDSGKEPETYQRHKNKAERTDFYRVRAEGHNTLVINPDKTPDQDPRGKAPFTDFVSDKSRSLAALDLVGAYGKNASKVTRSFELERGNHLTVTDKITCRKPSEIWSFFHTEAEVKLSDDKRSALLKQGGKTLKVNLVLPANAGFEVMNADPLPSSPNPAKQASNKARRKLAVHLSGAKNAEVSLRFERVKSLPASQGDTP